MDDVLRNLSDNIFIIGLLPLAVFFVLLVHEAGHFFAARMCGIRVEQISLGIGRRVIWRRKARNGIEWVVRPWPLAAHIALEPYHHDKKLRSRVLTVLAGPLANLALPFLLFFEFFILVGQPAIPPVVAGVDKALPAFAAGIAPGDVVLAIDGHPIRHGEDIGNFTHPKPPRPLVFTLKRGGEVLTKTATPAWLEYTEDTGLERERGHVGILLRHTPLLIRHLRTIEGVKIEGADAEARIRNARVALIDRLGQAATLGIKMSDGKIHDYAVLLDRDANAHLYDSGHKDYARFYPGALTDNFYMKLGIADSAAEAAKVAGTMIFNVMRIPFQLFPLDREWIAPDAVVSARTSPVIHTLFMLIHLTALLSTLIALINLVPFPGMDGSVILMDVVDELNGKPLAPRDRAMLLGSTMLFLYAVVFAANAPGMHKYFEAKYAKIQDKDD